MRTLNQSSIAVILKHEAYFSSNSTVTDQTVVSESCYTDTNADGNQDEIISKILVLTTSLLGVFLLVFGILRDFVSFGVCRLAMFSLLIASYALLAISTPGETDYLQFGWILQYGGGIGIFLNGLQFLAFYPGYEGLLTGVANALLAVGTLIPQVWLILITKQELLSFTEVMIIWMSLAVISLILGTLLYPWDNMPQDVSKSKAEEFYSVLEKKKNHEPICKGSEDSFISQLRENLSLIKSPIFVVHVIIFAVGNCTATLSLNFVNDYMCDSVEGNRLILFTVGFYSRRHLSLVFWNDRENYVLNIYPKTCTS